MVRGITPPPTSGCASWNSAGRLVSTGVGCATGQVTSLFGRTGAVTAQSGDYSAFYSLLLHTHTGVYEPVDATIIRSGGSYSDPSWLTLSINKTTGLQAALNGLVSLTGSYTNPSWLVSIPFTKVTGADALMVFSSGDGAPTSTPTKIGDVYSDITSDPKVTYIADCATSSGCWRSIGSGSSGATTANYLQSFTSQYSVALTHNAGTGGIIVQCWDATGKALEWDTLTKTSTTLATVTFTVAATGECGVNSSGGGSGGGGSPYVLPIAATDAIGGIMRNSGLAGQFVNGVNSLGQLTYGTPAGGGGGGGTYVTSSSIIVGDGTNGCDSGKLCVIGWGSVIPMYLSGSDSFTFSSIAAGACGDATTTLLLPGANNGDTVAVGRPPSLARGWKLFMDVTSANVVTVSLCNFTGATATPTAGLTYKATIVRGF